MSDFQPRELYGGAITARIPHNYIDSSDLRQIPDHQEVFLSPTTLTSVIFEVNQYVNATDDINAVNFHFTDVISEPDHLQGQLTAPTFLRMHDASIHDFPSYFTTGMIISPETDKKAPSALPIEWQQTPQTKDFHTKVYQLLIRMAKYETDLCVRVNVPLKEMADQDEISKEEEFAKAVIENIVASLSVQDFDLFASG